MDSKKTVILITFLSAFHILAASAISIASAGEVDCKGLISKIKTGARYVVSIDVQKKAMRVQTASDYCFDPINDWIKRGLDLASTPPLGASPQSGGNPTTISPSSPRYSTSTPADMLSPPPTLGPDGRVLPSLTNAEKDGAPPSMSFSGGGIRKSRRSSSTAAAPATESDRTGNASPLASSAHTSVGKGGDIVAYPDQKGPTGSAADGSQPGTPADQAKGAKCNRSLDEFWQAGTIDIGGKRNWLLGVYTIDQNDDEITDNLVFKVRTQGKVDRVIRYFPVEPGDTAAKDIADLKLDHDNLVGRICSDNQVFKGPTAKKMAIAEGEDNPALQCKWKLKNFWHEGTIDIRGTAYWLSGVFSIDLDGNGGVDNIGFKLQTRGKVGNVIRYFPLTAGQLSGQIIPDLALKDDNDVFKMCAGNLTFNKPRSLEKVAEISVDKKPNEKKKNKEATKKEISKPSLFSKLKFKHLVLIGGILLIGASLYGAYTLNRKEEDEDEEEDVKDA